MQVPDRFCDLVMKGGITSGIAYPLAIRQLSEVFRLKNLGGTSAGAIVAATAAAAEYGRLNDRGSRFTGLEALSTWLAKGDNLLSLFQPQPSTEPLLNAVLLCLHSDRKKVGLFRRLLRLLRGMPFFFWICFLVGLVPGAALWLAVVSAVDGWRLVLGGACALLLLVLGAFVLSSFSVLLILLRVFAAVSRNGYGICSGAQTRAGTPALTGWLSDRLNKLAGKNEDEPLTFGDLWNADPESKSRERSINLKMLTTCLSHGRPYRFPDDIGRFYFDREEFRELFPTDVVDWMEAHPRDSQRPAAVHENKDLRRFPDAENLPVIVGVRMSLSFPILLSAIRLYDVDYSLARNKEARKNGEPPVAEPCWFSDGGICSNFPIHSFDSPLPRWPTFGINLKSFHPEKTTEEEAVWLPRSNREGLNEIWQRFEKPPGISGVLAFLWTIVGTMQSWMDNLHTKLPGYRDRIVHISLDEDEGGLNLNMPPDVIERITKRGTRAGEKLREAFQDPHGDRWENHTWVRYRTTMCLLEKHLEALAGASKISPSTAHPLQDLIAEGSPSYRWTGDAQRDFALQETLNLLRTAVSWGQASESFCEGAPHPRPELRAIPKV